VSLTAFLLIVLAGLIHAGWNIVAKKAGGDARFAFFTAVWMMLVWAPLGGWLGRAEVPRWGATEWAFVAASGGCALVVSGCWWRGSRKAALPVAFPRGRGTGPLLPSLVAIVFLGERISALGMAGIVGVVLGVFLIAGGPGLLRAAHDPAARQRVHKGMFYGVVTGLFIAAYTVVDGYAVKVLLMSPILVDYMGNFFRVALLAPNALRDRAATLRLWRTQWRHALVVATISPVAYVLVLYAMREAPLSHVAPAREVSMLFAALLGGHLLGEGDRLARLLGAACIAGGVIALALG